MRRGDVVLVSAPGDFGKPRPATIIQSDLFNETHASIIVCLMTSDLQDAPLFRISVTPSDENGLAQASQIMVDKPVALRRERIAAHIGRLDEDTMVQVTRSFALFLGIAR